MGKTSTAFRHAIINAFAGLRMVMICIVAPPNLVDRHESLVRVVLNGMIMSCDGRIYFLVS
jgi:hypothetical protein